MVDVYKPTEGPVKAAMIMAHDAFGFDPATNIRVVRAGSYVVVSTHTPHSRKVVGSGETPQTK